MQEPQVQSFGQKDPLQKEMANHSSVLTWEIPGTEEPGGLQSRGSQKIRRVEPRLLERGRVNPELPTQCLMVSMKLIISTSSLDHSMPVRLTGRFKEEEGKKKSKIPHGF